MNFTPRSESGMSSVPYLVPGSSGGERREGEENQRLWNDNKISVAEGHAADAIAQNGRGGGGKDRESITLLDFQSSGIPLFHEYIQCG